MAKKLAQRLQEIADPSIDRLKKELAALKKENKQQQALLEQQQEMLDKARSPGFTIPLGKSAKTQRGDFTRVIIPDSHGSHIDKKAAAAFLADLERLNPAEIVMLGDHLDCGGFLAQHHTLGHVAETANTFEQDVQAANWFLDEIQKRAPKARVHYLEGNHEHRLEKWCVNSALRNQGDAEFLRKMVCVENVLHLPKRGVELYKQGVFYHDLPLPATIKLNNCYFTHGSSTAKHAARAHLDKFGGNIVHGHTHRIDQSASRTVKAGTIAAWCPGCLCVLQPLWMFTNFTEWNHGYGVQLVRAASDNFLHINVPIVNGVSLLGPLISRIAS